MARGNQMAPKACVTAATTKQPTQRAGKQQRGSEAGGSQTEEQSIVSSVASKAKNGEDSLKISTSLLPEDLDESQYMSRPQDNVRHSLGRQTPVIGRASLRDNQKLELFNNQRVDNK